LKVAKNARSDSDSQSRQIGRCWPSKQHHCLCCEARPRDRGVSYSLDCLPRRQNSGIGPQAAVDMALRSGQISFLPQYPNKHLTLLRRPTQHTRKWRTLTPNTLHARIIFLPPLQSSNALGLLCLHLLQTHNVGLHSPRLVVAAVWSESLALRIHCSCAPSESPLQTLPSRLRHAQLLFSFFTRNARVAP
jgi:hypothetical protein